MGLNPTLKLLCCGAFLALGCGGVQVSVDADVNGATGDAITDAFFGVGALEDEPFLLSEDANGNGFLDVDEDLDDDFFLDVEEDLNANGVLDGGEDIDGDGRLDVAEDVNGDGLLSINNEDTNGNGQIDLVPFDANQDGVVDENDNLTVALFFLVGSGGAVSCEAFADAFESGGDIIVDDTVLAVFGTQASLGPGIPNVFSSGSTAESREEDQTDLVFLQTAFGELVGGDEVDGRFAQDEATTVLEIATLNEKLDATLTATLSADGSEFPLSAEFRNVVACQPLSDVLQGLVESGDIDF